MTRETNDLLEETRERFPVKNPKYKLRDFIPAVGLVLRDIRRERENKDTLDYLQDRLNSALSEGSIGEVCYADVAYNDFHYRLSKSRIEPLIFAWHIGLPAACLAGFYLMEALK